MVSDTNHLKFCDMPRKRRATLRKKHSQLAKLIRKLHLSTKYSVEPSEFLVLI